MRAAKELENWGGIKEIMELGAFKNLIRVIASTSIL